MDYTWQLSLQPQHTMHAHAAGISVEALHMSLGLQWWHTAHACTGTAMLLAYATAAHNTHMQVAHTPTGFPAPHCAACNCCSDTLHKHAVATNKSDHDAVLWWWRNMHACSCPRKPPYPFHISVQPHHTACMPPALIHSCNHAAWFYSVGALNTHAACPHSQPDSYRLIKYSFSAQHTHGTGPHSLL